MGVEIERKFLPASDAWRAVAARSRATRIEQGFLAREASRVVRVRVEAPLEGGEPHATLTVKGRGHGHARAEFEYEIPVADARELLALALPVPIAKTRWRVDAGDGLVFEIDEFEAPHAGLVVIELELEREDQPFARPAWLGREVTGDPAYTNAELSKA